MPLTQRYGPCSCIDHADLLASYHDIHQQILREHKMIGSEAATPGWKPSHRAVPAPQGARRAAAWSEVGGRIGSVLKLVSDNVAYQRRVVHAGDRIYQAGEQFGNLYIVNSGFYKVVTLSPDGREQVVALKFRGDWLGVDGIARGEYDSEVLALDTGEVWVIRYDALLEAGLTERALLTELHQAMSREISRDRDSLMSLCTLSGDARVADFLRYWAESIGDRGMRTDQITLRMTRAEIGNYLGLTLESVSRALSRLAKANVIGFVSGGRRDVQIPDIDALDAFVRRSTSPAGLLQ
jgi:CRP/FNR family transcriptional regulator